MADTTVRARKGTKAKILAEKLEKQAKRVEARKKASAILVTSIQDAPPVPARGYTLEQLASLSALHNVKNPYQAGK